MDLQEAIIHAREASNRTDLCPECAHEHGQLADWLEELQRYKDTGLKPERICEFMEKWVKVVELAGLMKREGIEHLRDLVRAERENRLVLLPCRVGDTVYRVFSAPGREPVISAHTLMSVDYIVRWINKFGKTVFLTREEAERTLVPDANVWNKEGGEGKNEYER